MVLTPSTIRLKKNNFSLFKCPKQKSRQSKTVSSLKNDVSLFSRLYIVAKNRDCDMVTFFKHENQPFPQSISDNGKLWFSKKSDLLSFLPEDGQPEHPNIFDANIIDGAVLVHLLPTTSVATFNEYADLMCIPHLVRQLEDAPDLIKYGILTSKTALKHPPGKGEVRVLEGR